MNIKIVVAVENEETRTNCTSILSDKDVSCTFAKSVHHLHEILSTTSQNGILIDYQFKKSTGQGEQTALLNEAAEAFPVLLLGNISPKNELKTPESRLAQDEKSILYFLNHSCSRFDARVLRTGTRIAANFNVLLSKDLVYTPQRLERTITLNVSEEGCFLFYCPEWRYSTHVWFTISELSNSNPIMGEIMWNIEWGRSMQCPGLGLRFKQIAPEQIQELLEFAKNRK